MSKITESAKDDAHPRELRKLPEPVPMPDAEAYHRERELCLAADPLKKKNYERYMASRRRSSQLDYLPIKLDIENVSRCNFRCTMCQVSEWHKGQRARDMTLDEFKSIIDEQRGLVEIKLQGMGEPLMQRDPFFEMIRYAREKHIWVRTVTNASLLHLKDNYKKLVDADVNELQISVDGADKATFEEIRRGSVFERVVENCKLLNAYSREVDRMRTKMWTVVQRANRHQMTDLVNLANDMGFVSMVFALNLTNWGSDMWSERNDEVTVEDSMDTDFAWQLVKQGEKLGVRVAFWNITSKYRTDDPDTLCPWPFERAYVGSDLRVVPCCMIANPDACEIPDDGDGEFSFTRIWNNDAYADFRRAHLEGDIPDVCLQCYESRKA
ncbi:MAG: radical SAM protein [Rhodospirillales bacterium]